MWSVSYINWVVSIVYMYYNGIIKGINFKNNRFSTTDCIIFTLITNIFNSIFFVLYYICKYPLADFFFFKLNPIYAPNA